MSEFDVLGFKSLVYKTANSENTLQELYVSYFECFANNIFLTKAPLNNWPFYQVFSDSGITFAHFKSGDSFEVDYEEKMYDFFRHLSFIINDSLLKGNRENFPIRGGVSIGQLIIKDTNETNQNQHNRTIVGSPLVKAYEWEQCQNWIGISINPDDIAEIRSNMPNKWNDLISKLKNEIKTYKKQNKIYQKYYATKLFVEFIKKKINIFYRRAYVPTLLTPLLASPTVNT